jgi:ribosomal protein S28E/S33
MTEDGWETLQRRNGSFDYRRLVSDTGRPNYNGAAKRYAMLSTTAAGRVIVRNSSGYVRIYDTIEEAKNNAR